MEEILIIAIVIHYIKILGPKWVAIAILALAVGTFLGYVKVMIYYRKWKAGEAKWFHYLIGAPLGAIFLPIDMILNIIVGSILFLELPREFLFTARLDRHARKGSKLAQWICKYILNPFDEGHCYGGECSAFYENQK